MDTTTERAAASGGAAARVPALRLLFSPEGGVSSAPPRVLRAGTWLLGREVPADEGISIADDRRVSRRHAVLHVSLSGQEIRLVDQDSRNGSFVHGRRVSEQALADGDVLRIGDTFFLLRFDEEQAAAAPEVPGFAGPSPALRTLRLALSQTARGRAPVLLCGESGTGKGTAAEALHGLAGLGGPCLVLPGAATSAAHLRACIDGTLCVTHIEGLRADGQRALLGAMDAGRSRVLATTTRDPAALADLLRPELLGRFASRPLLLPPLRQRPEDILPLLLSLLPGAGRPSPDLVAALLQHPFPGNVRELVAIADRLHAATAVDLAACAGLLSLPMDPEDPPSLLLLLIYGLLPGVPR